MMSLLILIFEFFKIGLFSIGGALHAASSSPQV